VLASTRAKELESVALLSFHKDNYFLTGVTASTQVKFQFSIKFDVWPNSSQHAVFVGMTAKSIWDVYRRSSPFTENNYNPELFYTFFHHRGRHDPPVGCHFFHERLGLEHESNGEDDEASRSWNRVYAESRFACYGDEHGYAHATLKVWAPPVGTDDNPDIARYLGYGELALTAGTEGGDHWYGEADLTVRGQKGAGNRLAFGSVQVDGRWRPLFFSLSRFTPFLFAQMFTGYGETLRNYDNPQTSFRVGVGFSDRSAKR
jgi:phospholipase A1/A2